MRIGWLLLVLSPSIVFGSEPVAAIVNGEDIPMADVDRQLARRQKGSAPLPGSLVADLRRAVLDDLIDECLLKQFLAQEKIVVPDKVVDEQFKILAESLIKRGQSMDTFRKESGLSETDLREQFRLLIGFERFAERTGTADELKKFHALHKDYFDGVRVKCEALLIRVPKNATVAERQATRMTAESIASACRADATAFAKFAKSHSYHADSADLGWVSRFDSPVDESIAVAAYATPVNGISPIITVPAGFVLVRSLERSTAKPKPFEQIIDWVKETYSGSLRQVVLARQRQTAKIQITLP